MLWWKGVKGTYILVKNIYSINTVFVAFSCCNDFEALCQVFMIFFVCVRHYSISTSLLIFSNIKTISSMLSSKFTSILTISSWNDRCFILILNVLCVYSTLCMKHFFFSFFYYWDMAELLLQFLLDSQLFHLCIKTNSSSR